MGAWGPPGPGVGIDPNAAPGECQSAGGISTAAIHLSLEARARPAAVDPEGAPGGAIATGGPAARTASGNPLTQEAIEWQTAHRCRQPGRDRPGEETAAAVPGADPRCGRLSFAGEAFNVRITAAAGDELYGGRLTGCAPAARTAGGLVVVRFPRTRLCECWATPAGDPAAVTLGRGVRWEIAVRGGASHVVADLRRLDVARLDLGGGAGRVAIALPPTQGTVRLRILGGASNTVVYRPAGAAVSLRVAGGVTGVTLDAQRIGVSGGDVELHSPGGAGATGRYEIAVSGGANALVVALGPPPWGRLGAS